MSPDLEAIATIKDNTRADTTTTESVASDRLSPITEGSNECEESATLSAWLSHEDPEWQKELEETALLHHEVLEDFDADEGKEEDLDEPLPDLALPIGLLRADCSHLIMVPLDLEKAEPTEEHREIAFHPPVCQSIPNLPRKPGPDEMVVYKVTQQSARAEVVKRDDDVLTPQEVKDNLKEASEALLKELQTWAKLK